MRMASRCAYGSSRWVEVWGWGGARCLTCLQNGMEKLLSATGESTTRGREMKWERWHPSSARQCGARRTRRNHSHVGWPLNSAQGGHTPNCAPGEKPLKVFCLQELRLLGPERIWLGLFEVSPGPRLPGWQDRLRVPRGEQKWGQNAEGGEARSSRGFSLLQLLNQPLILLGISHFVPPQWWGGPRFLRWINLKPQKTEASWPSHQGLSHLWESEPYSDSWPQGIKPLSFPLLVSSPPPGRPAKLSSRGMTPSFLLVPTFFFFYVYKECPEPPFPCHSGSMFFHNTNNSLCAGLSGRWGGGESTVLFPSRGSQI